VPDGVSQSEKTVPNEEARHQPRKRKQVFLADSTGNARSKQLARGGRLFDAGSLWRLLDNDLATHLRMHGANVFVGTGLVETSGEFLAAVDRL
jgi:hypothetical protein